MEVRVDNENNSQNPGQISPPQTVSQPKKSHKPFYFIIGVLTLLIIGVGGIYGYFASVDDSDKSHKEIATKSWLTYINPDLGLKFNYPKSWGEVNVTEQAARNGKPGKTYTINFDKQNLDPTSGLPLNTSVTFFLETNDLQKKLCPDETGNNCVSTTGFSAKDIQTALGAKNNNFVASDKESYATVDNTDKGASVLLAYQTVSLPKINVSAVNGKYFIVKTGENLKQCPAKQFATKNKESCVSESAYIDLNKTLKSITGL